MSSAGWGDAIIMVPWTLYQKYGDIEVLRENFSAMKKWHVYSVKSAAGEKTGLNKYIWDTKFHYGDWMFPSMMIDNPNPMKSAEVTKNVVATAFLAHTSELLGKIATILGEDGTTYFDYAKKVRVAFTQLLVKNDRLVNDYQGCYVLAIAFKMIPNELKNKFVQRLVQLIHKNHDCLDTGFLATPYLLDVLTNNGHKKLAKMLFLQDKCPSWLYEVKNGATTIWESWTCIQPNGHVGTFSFNHYAMGCILDWFIREIIGLHAIQPGYKQILIQPRVNLLNDFDFSYQTPNGLIKLILHDIVYHVQADLEIKVEVIRPDGKKIVKNNYSWKNN